MTTVFALGLLLLCMGSIVTTLQPVTNTTCNAVVYLTGLGDILAIGAVS